MRKVIWLLNTDNVAPYALRAAVEAHAEDQVAPAPMPVRAAILARFVLSRLLIRVAAAEHADVPTAAVIVTERRGDVPHVQVRGGSELCCSLSHSGHWIACAIADGAIGIDIESTVRARDSVGVSAWAFTAAEHEWLLRQPDMTSAFYRLWTGKEAVFKLSRTLAPLRSPLDVMFETVRDELCVPRPARRLDFRELAPFLVGSVADLGITDDADVWGSVRMETVSSLLASRRLHHH